MSATDRLARLTLRLALYLAHPALLGRLDKFEEWPAKVMETGDSLTSRDMKRQFASVIDRVANGLVVIHASAAGNIGSGSYGAALDAISAVLESSDELLLAALKEDLIKKPPSDVAQRFISRIEERWESANTSEEARTFGRLALSLCCFALIAWYRTLPSQQSRLVWASLVESSRLVEVTQTMLLEVRRAGILGISNTLRIIGSQRRDLASDLGRMELFGLPLESRYRRVPLEISYLSARIATSQDPGGASGPLEVLLKHLLGRSNRQPRGIRLLISGKAGSGKTTAIQWIAFRGAQQQLPLSSKDRLLPLFVRLRETVSSTTPPSDRKLLYSGQLQEEVETQWLESCAQDATPLLLLDGWDELSRDKKKCAYQWIRSLIKRFPHAHFIVTSRPEGLIEMDETFPELDFVRVNMVPLQPEESRSLAERWFEGLMDNLYASPDIDLGTVQKAREDLLRDLTTPSIKEMADSPLLTSMLCCLYATTKYTTAPRTRGHLYELVASTLVHYRDLERHPRSDSTWNSYGLDAKMDLIGGIARVMSERGVGQLPIQQMAGSNNLPSLDELVSKRLGKLGRPVAETAKLREAMLDRSIILQRVSHNEAEFVHGSIQDYFAAADFQRSRDLRRMFIRAEGGQWALLPFACHRAPDEIANQIVSWLLTKLEESPDRAVRAIQFLLVGCLGAATAIDEDIRSRAEERVGALFPPRDEEEAKSLASSLGNSAIPYLDRSRTKSAEHRVAIDTLSRIQSSEAMDSLALYAREASGSDVEALAAAWGRFDPSEYSERVLVQIPRDLSLVVTDERRVHAAVRLKSITSLIMKGVRFSKKLDFVRVQPMDRIRTLGFVDCVDVGALDWTASRPSLRDLSIKRSSGFPSIGKLGPEALWSLHLEDLHVDEIDWCVLLQRLTKLRLLYLSNVANIQQTIPEDAFSRIQLLRTLVVDTKLRCGSLEFLVRNDRLTRATLGWFLSEKDVYYLSQCTSLHHLEVQLNEFQDGIYASPLRNLISLESLCLSGASPSLMQELASLPMLTTLHLKSSDIGRLDELIISARTRKLILSGCTFREQSGSTENRRLPAGPSCVEELAWRGGGLPDLLFIRHMPLLKTLHVEDDGSLTSLAGLEYVPDGCEVRLIGTGSTLDDEPLWRLRERGCKLIYEPRHDTETSAWYVDLGGS